VIATPDRAGLRAVQTPQGFHTDLLLRAYDRSPTDVTDDAALVENLGVQVIVVDGDPMAFKITTAFDLLLAQAVVNR